MTFNRDENKIRAEVERTFVGNLRVGLGFGTFSDGDRKHTIHDVNPFPWLHGAAIRFEKERLFLGGGDLLGSYWQWASLSSGRMMGLREQTVGTVHTAGSPAFSRASYLVNGISYYRTGYLAFQTGRSNKPNPHLR